MDNVTLIRVISGMLALFVFIPLYFLPAILARKKQQFVAILLLNIFLGWTFIGWLGALIWSVSNEPQPTQVIVQQGPPVIQASSLCPSCGKYSASGSKFCANCGQPFVAGTLV
jgi:hypothetical protein